MLRLPGRNPLESQVVDMLEQGCEKIIEVPGKNKARIAFSPESLQSINGITLVLGMEQERTEAGRGMVRGLWYDRPVVVWMRNDLKTLRLVGYPYRCHIVGPVFSQVFKEAKNHNPGAEVSVVWELIVDEHSVTDACPPGPAQQIPRGEKEYHLCHPSLAL